MVNAKPQFTAGPYTFGSYHIFSHAGESLATIRRFGDGDRDTEAIATGNLFAAAPDMYAALVELMAWCGPGTAQSLGAKCETLGDAEKMAEAALAKAVHQ